MITSLRCALFVGVAGLLTGCPTVPTRLAQPEHLSAAGNYTQAATGMIFPPQVGAFQRGPITQYDADGLDVSSGYNLTSMYGAITGTVYVYPSPPIVSFATPHDVLSEAQAKLSVQDYAAEKNEILHAHANARLVRETGFTLSQSGHTWHGALAVFAYTDNFGGQNLPLESRLYLFTYVADKWNVKYRFTFPAGFDADQSIDAFMKQLLWTIRGQ